MDRTGAKAAPLSRDDIIELQITSLAFGGRGVARRNGLVVFVEGALPGDRVRAQVTRSRRSYAEARTVEVIEASGKRIAPACRHFGDCGGCAWQTLEYPAQLRYKQQQVTDCLGRIGGLAGYEMDEPLAAADVWRYRNKVEFTFGESAGGPATSDGHIPGHGELQLGFHRPGDWKHIVGIEDCLLHSEATNAIRNRVRDFARSSGLGAWNQGAGGGFWRHLVLREAGGEVMANIVTGPGEFAGADDLARDLARDLTGAFPQIASIVWSINDTRASVATGFPFRVLAGRDHVFEKLDSLRLRVSPGSFLQTNSVMAGRLYGKALEYAAPAGGERMLDLFSGVGSIALYFARHCGEVLGIEVVEEASRQAVANAEGNGIVNASFIAGKVRAVLKEIDFEPDLVVLDPPRAGAGRKELMRIAALAPGRIVYVSCNASTMAGNAALLAEEGYRLRRIGAVDMFPHTPHIEAVALLEKSGGGPGTR